jgi:N-acetylglucosamine-6-sulfatase
MSGVGRLIISLIGLFVVPATAAESAPTHPNVVVILTDDQEDMGSMAYMPKSLFLLAERGVTFTNSLVNLSLCAPSRASFLTGQAAHNNGIRANSPVDGGGWEHFKNEERNALPIWLKAAGYKTALIGKYLNHYGEQSGFGAWLAWLGKHLNIEVDSASPRDWVPPGWDLWYAFTGPGRVRYYDYEINENGKISNFDHQPGDYSTDVIRRRAARFILEQSASATPFFLLISTKAVHPQGGHAIAALQYEQAFNDVRLPESPAFNEKDMSLKSMQPPALDKKKTQELELDYRATLQSLQSVDDLVEEVINALKTAGKIDNTVIIYTSDNGSLFGDHRMIGKTSAYEGSIKVPLIIRGPGVPKNEIREQLVNNLDVVATIVEMTGATPGLTLDGRSLVPLLSDANSQWRSAILIESSVNRWQSPSERFQGVRTPTKKYVKYESGVEELFDLNTDPYELKNEASNPSYEGDLTALRGTLELLKSCSGASCWR